MISDALPGFLRSLFLEQGVAQSLVVISLTVVLGLRFGDISFGKIRLGAAGALFVGLLLGAAGLTPPGPRRAFPGAPKGTTNDNETKNLANIEEFKEDEQS